MDKVLVTREVFDEAINALKREVSVDLNPTDSVLPPDELRERLQAADGVLSLVTDSIDRPILDACPRLRVVSNFAVGLDNIDVAAATEKGILVTNTPGILTETTADLAWSLMMTAARRIVEADSLVRNGDFQAWGPKMLLGADVFGKTLGILGLGRIGQAMARRAGGFDMRILYYDPIAGADSVDRPGVQKATLEEIYGEADFITLHVPLDDETHHLLDDRAFAQMKPGCIVVNTSRGPVVDEAALVRALSRKTIAGAALDVYEQEPRIHPGLLTLPNVVLSPHIGSATHETRLRMCMMAAENLLAALRGERPPNLVNVDAWDSRRQ